MKIVLETMSDSYRRSEQLCSSRRVNRKDARCKEGDCYPENVSLHGGFSQIGLKTVRGLSLFADAWCGEDALTVCSSSMGPPLLIPFSSLSGGTRAKHLVQCSEVQRQSQRPGMHRNIVGSVVPDPYILRWRGSLASLPGIATLT